MSMFCYQCQETAGGKGCQIKGVCGKNEDVAKLQDLLIYTLKGNFRNCCKRKAGRRRFRNCEPRSSEKPVHDDHECKL